MRKVIGVFGWAILILGGLAGVLVLLTAPAATHEIIRGSSFEESRVLVNSALRQAHFQRGFAILGSSLVSGLLLCGLEEALNHLVAIRSAMLEKSAPSV